MIVSPRVVRFALRAGDEDTVAVHTEKMGRSVGKKRGMYTAILYSDGK